MAFPISPSNNQQATVNGIVYVYSTATSAWTRLAQTIVSGSTASSLVSGTWTFALSSTGTVTLNGAVFSSGGGGSFTGGTVAGATQFNNATSSTGTNTGALTVTGGVGIGGTMYVGGVVNLTSTAASITTSSGALIVVGGVGVGGSITANNFSASASGTAPNTGIYQSGIGGILGFSAGGAKRMNLYAAGGLGIGDNITSESLLKLDPTNLTFSLYTPSATNAFGIYSVGGTYAPGYVNRAVVNVNSLRSATLDFYDGQDTGSAGTATTLYIEGAPIGSSNGATTAITNPYALYVNSGASYLGGSLKISSTTPSTSTTTGALQVAGGVGIGGDLYIGKTLTVNGTKIYPMAIQNFTAAANTTTFTISGGYSPTASIQVFANGLLLPSSDYTASNGTTIILTQPRNLNDQITIIFNPNSAPTTSASPNSLAIAIGVALGI
jgi:hypothetical protein